MVSKLYEIWSRSLLFTHPSLIQKAKRHRIPDPDSQNWYNIYLVVHFWASWIRIQILKSMQIRTRNIVYELQSFKLKHISFSKIFQWLTQLNSNIKSSYNRVSDWMFPSVTLPQWNEWYRTYYAVLRIRIQDWVSFWPLDPGWEKVSIQIRDPGWTTRIIFFRA